jgi:hypothetical protein
VAEAGHRCCTAVAQHDEGLSHLPDRYIEWIGVNGHTHDIDRRLVQAWMAELLDAGTASASDKELVQTSTRLARDGDDEVAGVEPRRVSCRAGAVNKQ